MANWIPFVEGEYAVEQAFIIAVDNRAVMVEDAVLEIYAGPQNQRHMKGSGRVQNILLVELLEKTNDLDLILDLGDEFIYRLRKPWLQSGKFFSAGARSSLQFRPSTPWEQIARADFEQLISGFEIIDHK
ncbi:MAG: hypothetical protein PVJ54_14530 [Desulfobacterales bacterium]|jgi:hypothetical protein